MDVNKLKKADQIKGKITELLKPKDLIDLANAEEIPHYILTNPATKEDIICFIQSEIDEWFLSFVKRKSRKVAPIINFLPNDTAIFKISPLANVPAALSTIKDLRKIPFSAFDSPSGVYFLCLGAEIVYIGQAKSILFRLSTHKKEKEFDSVYFIHCHVEQLCPLEKALIHYYQPKLNNSMIGIDATSEDLAILERFCVIEKQTYF